MYLLLYKIIQSSNLLKEICFYGEKNFSGCDSQRLHSPPSDIYLLLNLLPTHIPTYHWPVSTSLSCLAYVVFTFLKCTEKLNCRAPSSNGISPALPNSSSSFRDCLKRPLPCDTLSNTLLRQLLLPQCSLGPGSSFYFWHLLYCHYEFQGLHLCPPWSIIMPGT